jgi:2,3-bisphosphoglycerate-independent phosphoglycerate mutase
VDAEGRVTDRRAGRISTQETAPLCQALDRITVPEAELSVYPGEGYRFVLVLRGKGLSDQVSETDPERVGVPPLEVQAMTPEGERTARAANAFAREARRILAEHRPANMVLLRGFSHIPRLPSMGQRYRLNPAAIAAYPMYRGLASLLGMRVIPTGKSFPEEIETLSRHYAEHDFFYLHFKPADTAGEDGNFDAKVRALEELDGFIPTLLDLKPDVFILAGDHATPAVMATHTWHPVPFLLHSRWTQGEGVPSFDEKACATGSLGRIPAAQAMLLALAHAGKLTRYGP